MAAAANQTRPTVPHGAWPSPIDAQDLVVGAGEPTDVWADSGVTWWSQTRPDQGGRLQIVRRDPDGSIHDVLPQTWNARTRVHEYGGGAWWVHDGVVFAVDYADQRLYRAEPGTEPVPLTPTPALAGGLRYADGRLTPDGRYCVCVREWHDAQEVRNEIVAIEATGRLDAENSPSVLVSGPDFVASPRISPDGEHLAWIEWQHPNMPWDSTRLWTADLVRDGAGLRLKNTRAVAGDPDESLVQPEWAPDGALYVVSDRSDWWNVYRVDTEGLVPVHPLAAEVGQPAWVFGQSRYQPGPESVTMTWSGPEGAHLSTVMADGSVRDEILPPFLTLTSLRPDPDRSQVGGPRLVAIAALATGSPAVIELRPKADPAVPNPALSDQALPSPTEFGPTVLSPAVAELLPAEAISRPKRIDFPSAGGRTAHGLFYPPTSTQAQAPPGEKPPLLVTVHGGPTSAANPAFRPATQFWTSRGFAVVDVDYGGSTGYGRPYRRLLDGKWGIVDVEDACAAATWLAQEGWVDPDRLAIRGGSAGGFTVLSALARQNVFAAGTSLYGVADLGALARDTHKFESRYLDGLVGPWPEAEAVYVERSPLSHIDGFDRPLIVLQGDEDVVVPPAQAEAIVNALASKEVPHAYMLFAGEQHGFRRADTIIRALEAELSFYGQVFGFEPAGSIDPVPIAFAENLS
jgi:dipeptidyl aminopeptidase/acylaminoacyl peptidase